MSEPRAEFDNPYGSLGHGMDMLPKPLGAKLPLLITGGSQQDPDWIARHGANALRAHLESLRAAGVNHVALNLRFNRADIETTLERLADHVLPAFHG